eukprot:5533668-Pyramimonas_sp.AAC.1
MAAARAAIGRGARCRRKWPMPEVPPVSRPSRASSPLWYPKQQVPYHILTRGAPMRRGGGGGLDLGRPMWPGGALG